MHSYSFAYMRRLQLKIISHSFLIANLLAAIELAIVVNISHSDTATCASLCAEPATNGAAWLLLTIDLCHILPMEMFLVVFYLIPRRYYISGEEVDIKLDINEPLLDANKDFFEQNIN